MKNFILIASLFILSGCDYPVTNHKSTEKNKEIESCNKWFMSEAEINLCNLEIVNEVDKEINELISNLKAYKPNTDIGSLEDFKKNINLNDSIESYFKQSAEYKFKITQAAYSDLIPRDQVEVREENGLHLWYEINSNILLNGITFSINKKVSMDNGWTILSVKDGKVEEIHSYYKNGHLEAHTYDDAELGGVGEYFYKNGVRKNITYFDQRWKENGKPDEYFDLEGNPISSIEHWKLMCSIEDSNPSMCD